MIGWPRATVESPKAGHQRRYRPNIVSPCQVTRRSRVIHGGARCPSKARAGGAVDNPSPQWPSAPAFTGLVLLSVTLSTAGRYLLAKAGRAPADYEYIDPNI